MLFLEEAFMRSKKWLLLSRSVILRYREILMTYINRKTSQMNKIGVSLAAGVASFAHARLSSTQKWGSAEGQSLSAEVYLYCAVDWSCCCSHLWYS